MQYLMVSDFINLEDLGYSICLNFTDSEHRERLNFSHMLCKIHIFTLCVGFLMKRSSYFFPNYFDDFLQEFNIRIMTITSLTLYNLSLT